MTENVLPTDELAAVNAMLANIGQQPLNSLEGAIGSDAAVARGVLRRVSTAVQNEGWRFNTEFEFPVPLNSEDELQLPLNTLRFTTDVQFSSVDPVQRGTRLYDRKAHTYKFTAGVTGTIVLRLSFDELPESARQYIYVRAAREFQTNLQGLASIAKFDQAEEARARADMARTEAITERLNILGGFGSFRPGAALKR